MKITLPRAELAASLAQVTRIIESRNTIPILSNVLLKTGDDCITITATDLDIETTTRTTAECRIEEAGSITVHGRTLADIVKKLAGNDVALTVQENGVVVSAGRSRFTLQTLPPEDFSSLSADDLDTHFSMPAAQLSKLIADTSVAMSSEETRYYLNGIYLHPRDNKLVFVATDGHRLAKSEIVAPMGAENFAGIIIPRKTVGELDRLLKGFSADVEISLSKSKIRLTAGPTLMTSKLIDGSFPDYTRVIPNLAEHYINFTVNTDETLSAIERVGTVSSDRGRAVKFSPTLESLQLQVSTPEGETANDTVDAETTGLLEGDLFEIGFNGSYARDLLSALGTEEARFAIRDAGSPAVITDPNGSPDRLYVLMPMRV